MGQSCSSVPITLKALGSIPKPRNKKCTCISPVSHMSEEQEETMVSPVDE